MPYVSNGEVLQTRSPWRLSFIPELFWGMVNFVVLFFQTMINPGMTRRGNNYSTDYRSTGSGGGGGGGGGGRPDAPGPRRRMGGFGGRGGAPSAPPMAGGG